MTLGWVSMGHGQPPDALAIPVLFAFAVPAVAWAFRAKRTESPILAARGASARLAARLAGKRYVLTDRAVYAVASRAGGCTWERVALDGARCRREPLDAYAPGMASLVVRGASGRAVRLWPPVPGGRVAAGLDALAA